jgi:hypothetical protein
MGRSERPKGFGVGHQTPLHTQLGALLGLTIFNQKNGQKNSSVSRGHLIQWNLFSEKKGGAFQKVKCTPLVGPTFFKYHKKIFFNPLMFYIEQCT